MNQLVCSDHQQTCLYLGGAVEALLKFSLSERVPALIISPHIGHMRTRGPMNPLTIAGAQTVSRAMELLKLVAANQPGGLRLVDLTRMSGLERPTVHRLLASLAQEGLLMQEEGGKRYVLGPYCAQLGRASQADVGLLEHYSPLLRRISVATGDASFLVVQSGLDTLCIGRAIGTYPIQALAVNVGHRLPIGVGAGGVAILAALSKRNASELIWSNQDRLPHYRGLSSQALEALVATARQRRYSVTVNYAVSGVIGVGIVLRSSDGDIVGGLSVASIEKRMMPTRQEFVARAMREQAESFKPIAGHDSL